VDALPRIALRKSEKPDMPQYIRLFLWSEIVNRYIDIRINSHGKQKILFVRQSLLERTLKLQQTFYCNFHCHHRFFSIFYFLLSGKNLQLTIG